MKKTKSISKPQYLKKSVVIAYLNGTGKSQTQLENELDWGGREVFQNILLVKA